MKLSPRLLLLLVIPFAIVSVLATRPGAATITLRPEQTFQTMSGWEAIADMTPDPSHPWWEGHAEQALDLAVASGINRIRLPIKSGAETRSQIMTRHASGDVGAAAYSPARYTPENDNDDPFVIDPSGFDFGELDWLIKTSVLPLRQRLAARGERLWINLNYVSFHPVRTFQMSAEEYAELMLAVFQHMQDSYGILPDSIEMILEPDNSKQGWNGTLIGQAMVATAKRLQDNGFEVPQFVAPSVMNMANAVTFVNGIIRVPGARDLLDEISYHRYGSKSPRVLKGIADAAAGLGIRAAMLELWFGAATYHVLLEDLTIGNASAFQGRALHGLYVDPKGGQGNLRLSEDVRYNVQFYRSVRMGAVRIGADTTDPGQFDPVAFVNPTGKQVVVVVADAAGAVTVEGLDPGTYGLSYAIAGKSATLPDITLATNAPLVVDMPGKGVLTIEGK